MCWFRRLPFHACFCGTINKTQESGCPLFLTLIPLNFLLFQSKKLISICYPFFLFFFFHCLLSVFLSLFPCSLPTGSSEFPLVTAHPVISHSDSALSSLPCFKEPLPLGGEWTGIWTDAFRQQGRSCMLHPNSTSGEGREGEGRRDRETEREREGEEEESSQIHITHESHLTPTGRNHGPWRKGNSRPQALGELLGDREALYGRRAGVFAQMELTDTYRHNDNIQLNVNTRRHERNRHVTEIQPVTWRHGIKHEDREMSFLLKVENRCLLLNIRSIEIWLHTL